MCTRNTKVCTGTHFCVYHKIIGTQICPNMSKTRDYVINDFPADFSN